MTKASYFDEAGSAEAVNARIGDGVDPRLAEVMTSLVKHLHALAELRHVNKFIGRVGLVN